MEKRGFSHVEEILAFVIFVGFLVFALFFFNPFTSNRTLDSSLDYAIREIQNNATISLETYSVKTDQQVIGIIGIPLTLDLTGKKSRVEDKNGVKIPSSILGSAVHYQNPSDKFAKILVSKDFPPSSTQTGTVLTSNYVISSSEKTSVYSEASLVTLNSTYYTSYSALKIYLNLPTSVDFSFSVQFEDDKKINAEKPVPESLEVFSNSQRVEIIRSTGTDVGKVEFADLIVKVW